MKGEIDLPYLIADADRHGNVRLYVRKRRDTPKIRLREAPGTEAFLAEYRTALAEQVKPVSERRATIDAEAKANAVRVDRLPPPTPAKPGTLRALCQAYYASAEFKALVKADLRRKRLDSLCLETFGAQGEPCHGDKPVAQMMRRHVRKIRDARADAPEAANARLKDLRVLFAWAAENELVAANPAAEVRYIRIPTDGFHAWSIDEVRQYEARHPVGTQARLALALLLFAGVRRSDVVRLGRQMENSGWLRFTEAKDAKRHPKARETPILPELRAVIDATPSGHLTYLVTAFGKPFTANGFGNRMKKWCLEAGLPHCTAHGLRKAGAAIAAERGATEGQIMAIYGWESTKQANLYTRKARRKMMAGAAMHLIVPPDDDHGDG